MLEISTCTLIIASIVVVITFLKWYMGRNDDYWKKRGVPHMPRASYYAMWRNFGEKGMAGVVRDMGKNNLGRVYGAFEGSNPHVVVSDPDLLRDIFIKDFHIFPLRRSATIGDPLSDCAVSNLAGEQWKRVRTIITPAFTSKRMRQMGSIINECTKSLLEVCEKHYKEGKPVDCKGLFGAYTMDVIANSAFGTQIDSHNDPQNPFVQHVKKMVDGFSLITMIIALNAPDWFWKFVPSNLNPVRIDPDHFFRNVTMSVIQKRKESGRRYNDLLQILMDAADEANQVELTELAEDETDRFGSIVSDGIATSPQKYKSLSENEVLAQCVLLFFVGYETTSSNLTFCAYSLATNPDWQEKLIKEVDEAFEKHGEMSYDAVRDLKILDAVISETLRMHPPLAMTERTAVEDYEIGNTGVVVEKGMRVAIPALAMHFDPEFFEDPESFNPARFLEAPKHPQYAYIPFGMGPRNCLGMRFALLEIKICLSTLLRNFRIKPDSSTKVPVDYKKSFPLLTVSDLPLMFEKRTDVK
ncbi:Cytochrome P450 3A11 [Araneus ventricosus]|uniref:Cytochrome P450 3A11 n=1 Tax=Araneus ventricosus TaxID=182803 RepID=A0A4Y2G3E9_ARAVE|nr:Cytochrome P450 3A11 [Araneus ventricosus]